MDAVAGHPKAIRIAGRRMSQSNGPIKSPPSTNKGPAPSSSPEDRLGDMAVPSATDYPRPRAAHDDDDEQPHNDEAGGDRDEGGSNRRRKRDESRKKGMSSEEARLRKLEAPATLGKGASSRRTSNGTAGVRIAQPAGKMMS
ncbi:hypothetical protein ACQY0O_001361 [Thecaphora frezii]